MHRLAEGSQNGAGTGKGILLNAKPRPGAGNADFATAPSDHCDHLCRPQMNLRLTWKSQYDLASERHDLKHRPLPEPLSSGFFVSVPCPVFCRVEILFKGKFCVGLRRAL
jgi:hypothetical protein